MSFADSGTGSSACGNGGQAVQPGQPVQPPLHNGGGVSNPRLSYGSNGQYLAQPGDGARAVPKFTVGQRNRYPDGDDRNKVNGITSSGPGVWNDGDAITDVPARDDAQGNMRPRYGMETVENVIPTIQKQIESDIRFDMFDEVHPWFGNGSDNKLFIMEENRDKKIIYTKPMFTPGSYIGPIAGVTVPPWQLQRVMPESKMKQYGEQKKRKLNTLSNLVMTNGVKSTNVLGDDMGYPYDFSSSDLKRDKMSVLEPIINNNMEWEHVKDPTGVQLNKKKFRRLTDAQRYPRHLDSTVTGSGGPHLNKRRSLEVILQ